MEKIHLKKNNNNKRKKWILDNLLENQEFIIIRPKIPKTHLLPKVGNMTLLPNPGKPGFYGVGLPGRVISCQPCPHPPTPDP